MEKFFNNLGMLIHKIKTGHKMYDIGNEERVVMECSCGRYWSWFR